ncbi:alpha-L-fucosidase [Gaetbulibacter sp. M240]|uniref:alpha-L-fucosidase n=1 Tax=Gaetbulibacter sp. M240 TaxID=3126511 RepID=UPI00374F5ADF
MDWWKEAKFGMFIHWGVYSVPAGIYKGKEVLGIGEWIMNHGRIPVQDYKAYARQFNPVKYDPESWVKLAKDTGMKYLIITSKHHDGFALFDSKVSGWNVVDATPYGKDLLKPLAEACHREGIKLGFYYSQAQDWNNPGGAAAKGGHWDVAQQGNMDEYLANVAVPQVQEILKNYGEVNILWWDTPIKMTKERADKFLPVINQYPSLITNNRLGGGYNGDTDTPEQFVPQTGFPGRNWETCMTMNDTWGYKSTDNNWKSTKIILQTFIDIVSKGGNYLLNVGPTSQGLIPQPSIDRLKEVGLWMKLNGESIYGTTASPFQYLPWGRCTQKGNKLYLHVFDWPDDGELAVPLLNRVTKAYLLTAPDLALEVRKTRLKNSINLPLTAPDKNVSVIALEVEGEPLVLPLPSAGKKVISSSTKAGTNPAYLTDGDPKNKWQPSEDDGNPWLEIDLGKEISIGAISVVEPWHTWDKRSQIIEIQYRKDGIWNSATKFTTNGRGYLDKIVPINARRFRLRIIESKEPTLNEWILYRAN